MRKKIVIIIILAVLLVGTGIGVGAYFLLQNGLEQSDVSSNNEYLNDGYLNYEYLSNEYPNNQYSNIQHQNNDNLELIFYGVVDTPEEVVYLTTSFINQAGTMGEPLSVESCRLLNQENNFRSESLVELKQMIAPNSPAAIALESSSIQDVQSILALITFQVSYLTISENAILFYENYDERFYEVTISLISTEYVFGPITEFFYAEYHEPYYGVGHEHGDHSNCFHHLFYARVSESRFDLRRNHIHFDNISGIVIERNGEFLLYDITELMNTMSERFSIWDGQPWGWGNFDFQHDFETIGEVVCD